MGKRDHLKDYVPTEDGGYEYVGTRWSWPSPEVRAAFLKAARGLFAGAVIGLIGAGFIPAPGTFGAFYVVLPFAAGVAAAALSGVALYRLGSEPDPLRDHVYTKSASTLSVKLLAAAAALLACGVAALIHGIALAASSGGGSLLLTVLFSACTALSAFCFWRIHLAFSPIIFTPV